MANTSLLQVRTSAEDKEKASAILEKLGTNLSAVVNMLIKQISITEGIPFEVKMGRPVYSAEEAINEVRATMAFEDMDLTEEDVRMLYAIRMVMFRVMTCAGKFWEVQSSVCRMSYTATLILQRGICSAMPCFFSGRRRRFLGS